MAERSKAHAWKACGQVTVPRVRIPSTPPLHHYLKRCSLCFNSYNLYNYSYYAYLNFTRFNSITPVWFQCEVTNVVTISGVRDRKAN